ncbi:YhaN family protein [Beggiatoa leptomitoformis]|uniref:AAA family ATPase n=1 Tax=Beggiatoa leptomitoformis TaxID=288004 RepID=A0A2N9YIK8_9GAMM|nr:YhaN family protein [Beggiatoa leptomitoformis]ALG67469.1 AAA family ATPase [Beggiatoa leptomitoformis]AUI70313.1 AAA family ATPase [Beggiatoa leptomitoformis]
MKLLHLNLAAFGRFTNKSLDFSATDTNFHVIYGTNEAGKSTTRRALTHWLFGIPERTGDAYLHAPDQLRIGGKLRNMSGEELLFYRRKGRKNTLLDWQMNPLAEDSLLPFLNGMTEARFTALFCFDHECLRQGGEDLLQGGGDVGESLFEAGTGSLKLRELLTELDREADELFKARASKPRLNQTIKAYKEACSRMKDCSLSATRWAEQAKSLDEAYIQHQLLSEKLRALRAEQHRLTRIQRTRPLLHRHQDVTQQLDPLRAVITLADDAATRRIQANLTLNTALAQEKQVRQTIAELQAQAESLIIPDALLTHKDTIYNLRERLGSHQKAARDLPGVRTEMRTIEAEAQMLLRRIYPQLTLSDVPTLFISNPQRERLKQLADAYPALREKQASLQDRLEKIQQQLIQQKNVLDGLALPPDLSELKAALGRALKQGDLEESLAKEDKEVRLLTVKADIGLKQLGLWTGNLALLEQVALPPTERVEQFDRRFKEVENDRQRVKEKLLETRQRVSSATQKINALQWAGEIPTEADLHKARDVRQQRWQSLKHAQATAEMYHTFEDTVQQADDIADRLRREAHRVAELAALMAEQQNAQREQEQQAKKWHGLNDQLAALTTEWETVWQALGIKPYLPAEMRSWLNDCQQLRQQAELLRERRQHLEVKQELIANLCQSLTQALVKLPQNSLPLSRLADLIEQAQACIAEITDLQHHRDDLERQIRNQTAEQQRLESSHYQATDALKTWQADWTKALLPLQLPFDTAPDTARNVLDSLEQILNKIDKISSLRRRIERMDEDADVFRHDVERVVQNLTPELFNEPVEQSVPMLSNRVSQAERELTRFEQLQQRLHSENERLHKIVDSVQTTQAQLQALLTQAHCHDLKSLEIAEQASAKKQMLQRQLHEVEQQLTEQGEGLSLLDLARAADAVEVEQLTEQLENCTAQIQTLEKERSEWDQKIGELRLLLKQMDGNADAARAADEAQLALAEMQELSERYTHIYLAASVLRKSIERYREQHQAPLLQRASELFERLTLGNFQGLQVGFHGQTDQPILLGLRQLNREGIATTGMSDGTRDQLYLALRLASIERYLTKQSIMPLIVDDILLNFDDDRSLATLSVLNEVAKHTQVLFFTHHRRLVELAQTAVEGVMVHEMKDVA